MAEFTPKKLDINSINGGKQYEYGDGISPEAINAPIQSALYAQSIATNQPDISEVANIGTPEVSIVETKDGTPQLKFSNLGSKNYDVEIAETKKDVALLTAIAEQNNQFYKASIEESFESRTTANGLNVVNPSPAKVDKITGSTVKNENLIPFPYSNTSKEEYGLTFTINDNGSVRVTGTQNFESTGLVCDFTIMNNLTLSVGNYYLSGTPTGGGTYKYRLFVQILRANGTVSYVSDTGAGVSFLVEEGDKIQQLSIRVGGELQANASLTFYPMLNKGTLALPYQKYFNDEPFKNANISGIKSIGTNIFDIRKDYVLKSYAISVESKTDNEITLVNTTTDKYQQVSYPLSVQDGLIGKTIRFSAEWECTGGNNAYIALGWVNFKEDGSFKSISPIWNATASESNSGTVTKITKLANPDGLYSSTLCVVLYGNVNSSLSTVGSKVKFKNINVTVENDIVAYNPYVEDILNFENPIEIGLGTTLDLENQKIVEKGATIIFTGAENWKSYKYTSSGIGYTSLYVENAVDEPTNDRITDGVVTDGALINGYKDGGWWVGYDKQATILGAERYFNLTQFADPNNPTTDELKNLVTEWKAYLAKRHSEGNPVSIRYVSARVKFETPITLPNTYTVWNKGTEIVLQGEIDNSVYGAKSTSTIKYYILGGKI